MQKIIKKTTSEKQFLKFNSIPKMKLIPIQIHYASTILDFKKVVQSASIIHFFIHLYHKFMSFKSYTFLLYTYISICSIADVNYSK